jgi:integrase/recombinase XerD
MFERLFNYPKVLARHAAAPLRTERERFLQHCADQGMAQGTLISKANELLVIARRLDLSVAIVTREQINIAADRWAHDQRRRGRCDGLRWSRGRFAQVATDWLAFIGRLEIEQPELPGAQWIKPFAAYMRDERGLSPHTIRTSGWFIAKFFSQLTTQQRTLAQATISDVEDFLTSASEHGWCRVSLAKSAKVLRAFFRYAESRGWCAAGIAAGIIGPRVFRDEGLPVGPDWSDVERLISSTEGVAPGQIRDHAILQLLAIYGLRRGEVTALRLGDLNWAQDRIWVTRPKQRCRQEYPLLRAVGCSILRYLQQARPQSALREVFLTLKAPIRPLSPSALSTMVAARLRALDIQSLRYGPHALRHACAGRLVAQGLSLKEIGDHLGHRSVYATRTYAKVDLAGLRAVADLSLGGLL